MDNLFELLVALAIILYGLLGGGKKKTTKPPARQRPAPRPAQRPAQQPTQRAPTPPPVFSYDDADDGRIVSLETLEPAGEASHVAFHEKYVSPIDVPPVPPTLGRRPKGGLRAAVVWSEILGPPKGLLP